MPVVAAVSFLGFLCQGMYMCILPLFFNSRGLPHGAWETFNLYLLLSCVPAPFIAGVLSERFGERYLWSAGLVITAIAGLLTPFVLVTNMVVILALLCGTGMMFCWVGGTSLVQAVPKKEKGKANALFLVALGVGSISGPVLGSNMLRWTGFLPAFRLIVVLAVVVAVLTLFVEHSPLFRRRPHSPAAFPGLALLRKQQFLCLAMPLSLLGGAIFASVNIYSKYRAEDPSIGLIVGGLDKGWSSSWEA